MKKFINSSGNSAPRDPFITKHHGKYYRCYTESSDSVFIACADSLEALAKAEGTEVYVPEEGKEYSKQLWAPELHIIDGKCYIYVACDDGNNHNHRMYVLENGSDDPVLPYKMHGKITDASDKWAIDGTVVNINNTNYFVWSGWEGCENVCQNLYIAEMKSPFELYPERALISSPEYAWEKLGSTGAPGSPFINEGAFGVHHEGKFYLLYSAAGSWCKDYCISYLLFTGDDPLNASFWEKAKDPVLCANELLKGAGHCSVIEEEGKNIIFFHAWDKEETNVTWNTVSVWQGELSFDNNGVVIK